MRQVVLILSALLASASVAAQTPPAPQSTQQAQEQPKGERMICRRDVQIGSLVRAKKTCRTKAEWDQIGLAAREGAQYLVDQNAGRPSGN